MAVNTSKNPDDYKKEIIKKGHKIVEQDIYQTL